MPQNADMLFYQLYFQTPGVAEAEFERDVRLTLRTILYAISGDAPRLVGSVVDRNAVGMVHRKRGFLGQLLNPVSLPSWLSETDVDFYATEFARTGFRGALNWYRNIDRNWELLAPFAGAKVSIPALYMAGERDVVLDFPGIRERIRNMAKFVPVLRRTIILQGCGHWIQQERAVEVNDAIIDVVRHLS
jgi:pimeloyl-ACP methyl ester carboxylesterase